ncbi:alpha/beta fold hydrolase, partial [Staphylococcus aureus]|uniref:alpha/beta fold hydrolase n=1 Tax=Staphylococcus aureus TaxID=1280 RepID=UPI0039BE4F53
MHRRFVIHGSRLTAWEGASILIRMDAPALLLPPRQTEPFVNRDGLHLAVEAQGGAGGPILLFAHGFGQTRGAWNGAAAALAAQGHRCISFDARGHGESGRAPDGGYHMQQFVDDLLALARAQP